VWSGGPIKQQKNRGGSAVLELPFEEITFTSITIIRMNVNGQEDLKPNLHLRSG